MEQTLINHYNKNDASYIVNTYIPTINLFCEDISNIENNNNGSNTQLTATQHENKCIEIIKRRFNTSTLNKESFRKFISYNGRIWCKK